MPRELSKCREWEKDRRDRLRKGFASLSKILPCYEPSINLSKVEILEKAESYIEELQTQIKELLDGKGTKPECSTIKKLHDRVKKLVIRNEQLCNLLIDAGIKLPSECGNVKKFRGTRIWSNRLTSEQAKKLLKKEKEHEDKKGKKNVANKSSKIKNVTLKKKLPKKAKANGKQTITTNFLQSSNFITLVTTQSCFIITNAPSTNVNQNCLTKTTTVLTNSNLFSTPLVASTVKPPLVVTKSNGAINTVSSGTLLVANGSLLPVIQQPTLVPTPTIITNPTPIVVKPSPTNNTTLFVVPKSDIQDVSVNKHVPALTSSTKTTASAKATNVLKSLPLLMPKRNEVTNTTHVNKVPIPALTSKHGSDSIPNVSNARNTKSTKNKSNKNTKKDKTVKNIQPEKSTPEGEINKDETENTKSEDSTLHEKRKEKIEDSQCEEITEPELKKSKLSPECAQTENDENKKVNIVSVYSIDSLCNVLTESTNTVTEQSPKETLTSQPPPKEDSTSEAQNKINEKQTKAPAEVPEIEIETVPIEQSTLEEASALPVARITTDIEVQKTKHGTDVDKVKEQKSIEISNTLMHSDLSNDIFASLSHVSTGGQNPESTSPTAAFLLAFPLVSSLNSLKVTEVIEDETTESPHGTPTLLQIGTMDSTKTTQSQSENLTPSLLNLDNFSFFSKEFYPSFDSMVTSSAPPICPTVTSSTKISESKKDFVDFNSSISEKKNTSELHAKNDLKFTLKSLSNKESIVYMGDNKTNVSQNPASVPICQAPPIVTLCQNAAVASACHNTSGVSICQNALITPTCQNNSTARVRHAGSIIPVCQPPPIVPVCHVASVVSVCQSTTTVSACQPAIVPMSQSTTTVSVCQTAAMAAVVCQNEIPSSFPNTNTFINGAPGEYNLSYSHSFYSNAQTVTTSSTTTMTSAKHQSEKAKITEKKSCNYYPPTTSYSLPQYNTFNPFTDIPKSTATYPISTKTYNDTLYTSNTTYPYNYSDNFNSTYPSTKSNMKPDKLYYGLNYDNYEYKHNDFQKYDSRNQQFGNYYGQNHVQNKGKSSTETVVKNNLNTNTNSKVPVNWMTTPDVRQQPQNEFLVPPLGKEMDFVPNSIYSSNTFSTPQTTYFNANASLYSSSDLHNTAPFPTIAPNSFQRNDAEENQFSWSPSKLPQLIDTAHNFVSGSLPTLVGDLALGNTQPFTEQKVDNKVTKDNRLKENARRLKSQTNYDNQSNNFLSVSQLVDHNKSDNAPGRVTNRRSSGNRSNSKSCSGTKNTKRISKNDKDVHNFGNSNSKVADKQIKHTNHEYQSQNNDNSNWMNTNKNRNIKIPSSSYSAEALIGHQNQTDITRSRNPQSYPIVNKSLPVPFLTDNIIPYFPMDIPQENTLAQPNQNYQSNTFGHNFSSGIQGGVYPNSSFVPNSVPITTSYLPSTNFIPDIGANADYTAMLPENTFTHVMNRATDKFSKNKFLQNEKPNEKRNVLQSNTNCSINSLSSAKKSKKRQHNDANLSNLDFSFLSMPTAVNSPILPDDFHAHSNFLPPPTPTQLYPCKNPLYGKQELSTNSLLPLAASRSGIPHPEVSPSLNNVGTTLTNFNLSTIFPEINKASGPITDMYSDNGKAKNYNQREFLGSTS